MELRVTSPAGTSDTVTPADLLGPARARLDALQVLAVVPPRPPPEVVGRGPLVEVRCTGAACLGGSDGWGAPEHPWAPDTCGPLPAR